MKRSMCRMGLSASTPARRRWWMLVCAGSWLLGGSLLHVQLLAQEAPAEPAAPAVEADAPAAEADAPAAEAAEAPAPAVAVEAPAAPVVEVAAPVVEVAAPVITRTDPATLAGVTVMSTPEGSDLISVTLDDVSLPDVVRLFTRLSGANIIAATTNLKGSVTANLRNVRWQPAFEAILERQNLRLVEKPPESGIYVVEPQQADAPDPRVTETYKLSYVRTEIASNVVASLLGTEVSTKFSKDGKEVRTEILGGTVTPYPAGNTLVVRTTVAKQSEIKRVMAMIDVPREQVYIEAKIVELSGEASKKLGIDWQMLDNYRVGVGGKPDADGKLTAMTREYKSTEIRERGGANYSGGERSSAWDSRGRTATGLTDPTTGGGAPVDGLGGAIGVEGDGNGSANPYFNGGLAATPGAIAVQGWNSADGLWRAVTDNRTAVFSADALQLVLSALQVNDDTTVISNPKIIVANEEHAVIDISQKEPYIKVKTEAGKADEAGRISADTYSTELEVIPGKNEGIPYIEQAFFTYGIKVEVTPRINNASNITVTIEPSLSRRSENTYATIPGVIKYPVIDIQRVRTVFSLADGKTAMIGGLTTTRDRDVVKKIPLLGDIPLLGRLFSHSEKVKEQFETIIFVTVGIVSPMAEGAGMSVPEASKLVHKHITPDGHLIDPEQPAAPAEAAPAPVAAP